MKSAWCKDLFDLAAWNASQIEEVDLDMVPYKELLHEDAAINA